MVYLNNKTYLVFVSDDEISVAPVNTLSYRQSMYDTTSLNCMTSLEVESSGRICRYNRSKCVDISEKDIANLFKSAGEELIKKG